MSFFKIIYQLIALLGLTDSEEDSKLHLDIAKWEKDAGREDATKFEKLYHKVHQGIYFRLVSPFLLIYLKKWADTALNGDPMKDRDYQLRD